VGEVHLTPDSAHPTMEEQTDAAVVLSLENVCKAFGEIQAVRDLTLRIPRGAIYGIIGPNGAGKTTTLRMILDIIAPDSGRIAWNFARDGQRFDRIGYAPEEGGLYKKMTVERTLFFLAEIKSVSNRLAGERMTPWLDRLGLTAWRKRRIGDLSKGMQQKVRFIGTLLHEPELIILDEVFSGLDPINAEAIKDALLDLRASGTTILFSTHVMEQAEKLCDFVCMIDRGTKVLDGPLGEVKSQFGSDAVLIEGDFSAEDLRALPGIRTVRAERRVFELTLEPDIDTASLFAAIAQRGRLDRLERQKPSLHHIFLAVAGGATANSD
jgi:ABC-2 type transport system ATP-binding protein